MKDQPRPFVIHGVQHIFYPPDTLERWPDDNRASRLVFITKDLAEETVRRHFKPFIGEAASVPIAKFVEIPAATTERTSRSRGH